MDVNRMAPRSVLNGYRTHLSHPGSWSRSSEKTSEHYNSTQFTLPRYRYLSRNRCHADANEPLQITVIPPQLKSVFLFLIAQYLCRELDYKDEEREILVRKLIVHSKNPDGQKRQKAIATLGVIGPKDSESIMKAIAHGLADKEVTNLPLMDPILPQHSWPLGRGNAAKNFYIDPPLLAQVWNALKLQL